MKAHHISKGSLSPEQIKHARDVLSQVNVSAICRELKVARQTINHVLNGNSRNTSALIDVVELAKKHLEESKAKIERL